MTSQPRSPFRIPRSPAAVLAGALLAVALLFATIAVAAPKVIVISLDGATPRFVDQYLATGALGPNEGLGLLKRVGIHAKQNVTINPSLTAAGHIAIATGSTAAHNDVVANTFHLVASPFASNVSGFAAPVGGYSIDGPAESPVVTSELIWIALREAGRKVAAATFPGADGLDIRIPGLANSPIVQRAAERTVDYTVPFGAFAGIGAQGFSLVAANFSPAPTSTVNHYRAYRETSYTVASRAVQRIVEAVGTDAGGRPRSNIIVVSDHGFETFHTAVNMPAFLASRGFDPAKVRAVTSGPAANVYINLQGREPNGTVGRDEYLLLQEQIASALGSLVDANPNYTNGAASIPVFDKVYRRPVPADIADPSFGRGTSEFIGQDSGDVSALLTVGYNFDGTQSPVVQRLGDAPATTPVLSLPNFYGAHGYDPLLPNMSAIFIAAGPDIRPGSLARVRNIDIAPTIGRLLGVKHASLVDGSALPVRMPRRVQVALIDGLQRLLPTGDKKLDGRIAKAVRSLQLGLDARLWADDAHLTGKGQRVFQEARNAASELSTATGSSSVTEALDGIVAVAEELAAIAIDEAVAAGGDPVKLAHAKAHMVDASTAIAGGRFADAVHSYRQAWDYAGRAAARLATAP